MKKNLLIIAIIIIFYLSSACVPATPEYSFTSLLGTATVIANLDATRDAESEILSEKFLTFTPQMTEEGQITPTHQVKISTPTSELIPTKSIAYFPEDEGFNRPEGILEIINFARNQDGGQIPGCSKEMISPTVDQYSPTQFELTGYLLVTFCGWLEGEKVQVTINYPDGRRITQEYKAEAMATEEHTPYVAIAKELELTDPTGDYLITAIGEQSGSVSLYVKVNQPLKPQIQQKDESLVILSFFRPGERVRVFVYELSDSENYRFKSWQDFTMNQDGLLWVEIGDACEANCYFAAIGEQSGEAFDTLSSQTYLSIQTSNPPELQCTGAPLQRLRIGSRGYVCSDQVSRPLYRQPKSSAPILLDLPTNTFFEIIRGPICQDGDTFWRIRLDSGRTGWITEGVGEPVSYFLCPAP